MRFIANGPYIPDELLLARDEGGVLFPVVRVSHVQRPIYMISQVLQKLY